MLFSLYNENEPFLVNDDDNSTNVRYITGEIKIKIYVRDSVILTATRVI
jgi:hypothetical protein